MLFLLIKHNPSKKGNKKENESTQSPHYSYIMPMCNARRKKKVKRKKNFVFVQKERIKKNRARYKYAIVYYSIAEIMISLANKICECL